MSREDERRLSTADFVAATERSSADQRDMHSESMREDQQLMSQDAQLMSQDKQLMSQDKQMMAPDEQRMSRDQLQQDQQQLAELFLAPAADDFRRRWDAIQIGFVDDPRLAVRHADELVAQVMQSLAETFASQRSAIEAGIGQSEQANTENLRVALQRYRSFFQRLLSL
ncbi:MAG TPA: hypothetical protein VLK85_29625 [Ramlibacter sp.]|nr:hypothetical protein [Ramlibacter sp.]